MRKKLALTPLWPQNYNLTFKDATSELFLDGLAGVKVQKKRQKRPFYYSYFLAALLCPDNLFLSLKLLQNIYPLYALKNFLLRLAEHFEAIGEFNLVPPKYAQENDHNMGCFHEQFLQFDFYWEAESSIIQENLHNNL